MRAILFVSAIFLCGVKEVSSSASRDDNDNDNNNNNEGSEGTHNFQTSSCSLYLAKSTIENAGLGIFTGIPLRKGDQIGYGDLSIPIIDLDYHVGASRITEDYHCLLQEYIWQPHMVNSNMVKNEGTGEDTMAFVPGLGSLPNCHLCLKNIKEGKSEYDTAARLVGGGRIMDPGVGAFTPYHNRSSKVSNMAVVAGSELFVDYGTLWFTSREEDLGLVPLAESYPKASRFLKSFQKLVEKTTSSTLQGDSESLSSSSEEALEGAMLDLFHMVIDFPYKSRPLAAIPKSWSTTKHAFEVGIYQTELENSIRSLDYLEHHGKCLDNIQPGTSTIPHAGRGAFATRFIPRNGYVGIAPLLHIPDRDTLTMYATTNNTVDPEKTGRISQAATGHQLLLNYCFGHNSSSLLLCPNTGTSFINHDGVTPNTKILWSEDPTYHTSEWMEEPVSFFDNIWHVGLAFEYVAISDIRPGDEITVDYGREWEDAWLEHMERWTGPDKDAETYILPQELNANYSIPIPTYEEDNNTMVGKTIRAECHFMRESAENHTQKVWQWTEKDMNGGKHEVRRVIDRKQLPSDQSYVYTVELAIQTHGKDPVPNTVVGVPRKALSFTHTEYQSDSLIQGVFRHEMMIPDEIFPNAWKNIV
mmetsp:Transcript_30722/g.66428  ORF Transcript_30722/g.66428 Transcript_30722/m.66428 type:complete len:642 (+) Transcript_30722:93-2018(+)